MKPDPEPWYSTTLNLWQAAGVLVASWTLTKTLTEGWRRTVGRRRYVTTRLRKITPGVRHDYVESLLDKPRWQSTLHATRLAPDEQPEGADDGERKVELTVRTWLLSRLCYLVTWCEDDVVVMYGITTTSWWFRPWIRVNETRIRLGKSTFATLSDDSTVIHRAWLGNRRYGYFEEHYFGNVGGYRSWYVGVNDFGSNAFAVSDDWFDPSDIRHTLLLPEPRAAYRGACRSTRSSSAASPCSKKSRKAPSSVFPWASTRTWSGWPIPSITCSTAASAEFIGGSGRGAGR
uniref:Uncharacterized protein n=1 Tax=Streptomyces avermitilis TaxID=33903 RepID=A0A499W330_STRAX|nr:hypothetical protein SAVMC3_90600 [Streptomyces avermitilis]